MLEKEKDCVFLETARPDEQNFLSYVFLKPKRVISTFKIEEIETSLAELNKALKKGYYAAGFLSYEAGEAFEATLRHRRCYGFPLLWFGIYKEPLIYDHRKARFIKKVVLPKNYKQKSYTIKNIRPNVSRSSYIKAIAKIKALIAKGFTYQVNYTFKLKFLFSGSPQGLYLELRDKQAVAYSSLVKTGRYCVLSFSPELFFMKNRGVILARPMKGTASRGKDLKEDTEIAQQLKNSLKNRSENVMIVDLLRNDLGRVSSTGSVTVPRLFNVEKHETLFQMTSDIESRLKVRNLAFDIFRHIFPSGSVTGAPKIKTMQIIKQLEKEPRNVYTGGIGFFSPENLGVFNVAIRTLLIDTRARSGEMGVGSGIIYDSDSRSEYAECRLKADFLVKKAKKFKLIETMLWQPCKGYLFLDLHLKRLENSAKYFNFAHNKESILKALQKLQKSFNRHAYRIRLLLEKNGNIGLESSLLKLSPEKTPKIYLSTRKTHSENPFLYHKTTNRKVYDAEYKRSKALGFYDVIFANQKGEITEGAISNIFIRKNAKFYTPPKSCGLLDGVYRKYLLSLRKHVVKEKVLFKKDLLDAEEIYLSNSVRGLVRVRLEGKNH